MALPTLRTRPPLGRALVLLLAAAALTACSDAGSPLGPGRRAVSWLRAPGPATTVQMLACTASPAVGTVACARPGTPDELLLGGSYVSLPTSNAAYDPGTETFTVDLTVQNLLAHQAMGTEDGATLSATGVRVFFQSGPTVTAGTGLVTVDNPDGIGTFTAPGQLYYQYDEIVGPSGVSAPKSWQFGVPSTVQDFGFTLYVSTHVQALLVINEVIPNPAAVADADGEWFEIYNHGQFTHTLTNFMIADSSLSGVFPTTLPGIQVPAGGYVVLGASSNTATNGGVSVDFAYGGALSLHNVSDAIKLVAPTGVTLDRVEWSSPLTVKSGASRELKNPALDNAAVDGSDWANATALYNAADKGTPGAQNSVYVP